ncbi:PH domain-containing protein [Candidatus Woesebacteria bacterium]|nr:PH domain-containing protein [Candidatus Woesebacteria bacterium]
MRISKRVYQASNGKNKADDPQYQYHEIRESIWSLASRLFAFELLIGLLGLSFRIPILWLMPNIETGWGTIIIYIIIYLIIQIINVSILVFLILNWYNRTYIFRGKDLLFRWGILSTTDKIFQFDNVEKVTIRQNLLGRIFNYGTIDIYNPLIKEDAYMVSIPNPKHYADVIQGVVPKSNDSVIIPQRH